MSKKGKTISLITVLAMILSLVAVIPLALAGADTGTGGDAVEFLSYEDFVGDTGDLSGFTDVDSFDGVEEEVDFVSVQSNTEILPAFAGYNVATLKATVPDDNEGLPVTSENPEKIDVADQLITAGPDCSGGCAADVINTIIDADDDGSVTDEVSVVFTDDDATDGGATGATVTTAGGSTVTVTTTGGDEEVKDGDEVVVTISVFGDSTPSSGTGDTTPGNSVPGDSDVVTFFSQNIPLVDNDNSGNVTTDDVIVTTCTVCTGGDDVVSEPISIDPATGTITLDTGVAGIPPDPGDTVEIDYSHSDTDSTSVTVTSDSEPTSASGLALEVDFDGTSTDVSEDSDDFLAFFLLITDEDESTLKRVIREDPLGTIDDIDKFIGDVAALLAFDLEEDGCDDDDRDVDPPDTEECIDLDGMEDDEWFFAAAGVVDWQEKILTDAADVELVDVDDITDGTDGPSDFFKLTLVIAEGDSIEAEVGTATATDTVLADLTDPVVDVLEPLDGDSISDANPFYKVDVTDPGAKALVGSGIPLDDDHINFDTAGDSSIGIDPKDPDLTITGVNDGHRLRFLDDALADGDYTWGVVVEDDVGNATGTISDFDLRIDTVAPDFVGAGTQTGLGVSDGAEGSDPDGIRVQFDGAMDSASLDEDDFDVTGFSPPDAVAHFSELEKTETFGPTIGTEDVFVLEDDALDTNGDDVVDEDDISVLVERVDAAPGDDDGDEFLTVLNDVADVSGDGRVDGADVSVVVDNFPFGVIEITDSTIELDDDVAVGTDIEVTYSFDPTIDDFDGVDTVTLDGDVTPEAGDVTGGDVVSITYTFNSSDFVYLTVEGLDPGAEPDLSVTDDAGGITDVAGNESVPADLEDFGVTDAIDPGVTVDTGSLIADEEELTILIESNERLDALMVTINGVEFVLADDELVEISTTEYEITVTGGDADFGLGADGFALIEIEAEDANTNVTILNIVGFDGLEVDLAVSGVADPVTHTGDIDVPLEDGDDVFQGLDNIVRVEVDFAGEADEYTGDGRPGVTATSALLGWNTIQLTEGPDLGTGTGGSGQSGTATLTAVGDKTRVDISVTAGISGIQHIHTGTSSAIGAVAFDLGTIGADGTSSTLVDVPIDDLRTGDFAINLHDATDPSIYTSSGDIPVAQDLLPVGFDASDDLDGSAWGFATPLPVGDYSFSLAVEDEAGNAWSETVAFRVEPPTEFVIPIEPGWNLISVPSRLDAATPAKVFGDTSPSVTKIRTWSQATGWEISNFKDGAWTGDILALKPGTGYWVFSENADDATVVLRRIAGLPPAPAPQPVVAGWNLLGPQFFNLPIEADILDATPATAYWGEDSGLDANPWYHFEAVSQEFHRNDVLLLPGQGFWVWFDEDGQIIP